MKPFSFTKREENCSRVTSASCERAAHVIPKKKKKRFRARPVPKNLFSNYIYDKMREDDFFRLVIKYYLVYSPNEYPIYSIFLSLCQKRGVISLIV